MRSDQTLASLSALMENLSGVTFGRHRMNLDESVLLIADLSAYNRYQDVLNRDVVDVAAFPTTLRGTHLNPHLVDVFLSFEAQIRQFHHSS